MAHIFMAVGLAPSFRYEKFRAEWSDGEGHVVLDETPIGNIAEFEGTPEWIDRTAAQLGVALAVGSDESGAGDVQLRLFRVKTKKGLTSLG